MAPAKKAGHSAPSVNGIRHWIRFPGREVVVDGRANAKHMPRGRFVETSKKGQWLNENSVLPIFWVQPHY